MSNPNIDTSIITKEFSAKIKLENRKALITRTAPLLVLFALILVFTIALGSDFASLDNLMVVLNQLSIPLLIATGLTFVIILGSIDLSIDGVVGMAGSLMSILVLNNKNSNDLGFVGILIALACCVAVGFIIGLIHVKLKIPSFMVSFSFMFICIGIGMLSYGGIPATIEDPLLRKIPKMSFIGLPIITWVSLIVFFICYLIQEYTAFGRHMYAVGTAEKIPRMVGINVDKVKIMVFTLAGLCTGIAGILGGIRLGQGQAHIGTGMMFSAQAGVVAGGTSLSGGTGGVFQTLVGVLIITILENGLTLLGVDPYIKSGVQGLIIIAAVGLTVSRSSKTICK